MAYTLQIALGVELKVAFITPVMSRTIHIVLIELSFGFVIHLTLDASPMATGSSQVGYQGRPVFEMCVVSLAPGVRVGVYPVLVQIFSGIELPLARVTIIFVVAFQVVISGVVFRKFRLYSTCRDTYYGILELEMRLTGDYSILIAGLIWVTVLSVRMKER